MKKGFTLVEIMIVVAIIALLAAIAIPNLLRARVSAQEAAAAAALKTIAAAQIQYRASNPTYATLADLGNANPPYIDKALANGSKQGYKFNVPQNTETQFYATAIPDNPQQARTFYIDESGVLCRSTTTGVSSVSSRASGEEPCPSGFEQIE